MFGKHHNVKQFLSKTKNILGGAFHHTKNIINNIDDGMKTFKNVYRVAAPYLSHMEFQLDINM